MERRFDCIACGKCCYGWLPLTLDDALSHVGRFPLFVVWTPVRKGGKSFEQTARLGVTIKLKKRNQAALRISPVAYIPPSLPCPELSDDGLCAIHGNKPLRCRAMPFDASRSEADQTDLLLPRAGWLCDISEKAAAVYDDGKIIGREDFDRERSALARDASILGPYGEWLLDSVPSLKQEIMKVASKPRGGYVVVNFLTLIPRLPKVDMFEFARRQGPVMEAFAEMTAGITDLADYHKRYKKSAMELGRIVKRHP